MPGLLRSASALVVLALAAIGSAAAGSASDAGARERRAAPSWQHLSSLDHGHGTALVGATWHGGRVWFTLGSQREVAIGSAGVRAGRLTAEKVSRVRTPLDWYPIAIGSEVLHPLGRAAVGSSRLLPSGKVDPAAAVSPDPMAIKVGVPVAAARVDGRIVWALAGGVQIGGGMNYRPSMWVCCDADGNGQNLSSFATLRTQSPPRAHAMGVDGRGRVWLAWVDGRLARDEVRVLELDPATLEPRTKKAVVAPVPRLSGPGLRIQPLSFPCAATCRVVVGSTYDLPTGGGRDRLVTWSPGERSATRIELPGGPGAGEPNLIAAGFRGGRLAVAYREDSSEKSTSAVKVAVGDGRGGRARLAASVELPSRSRGLPMWLYRAAAFTPSGFVLAQTYSNYGLRGHVLATVVPLR